MFKGNITVIGASGNVGRTFLHILTKSDIFQYASVRATGSNKSAGKSLSINEREFTILNTHEIDFLPNEICVFNTESDVSSYYIPKALAAGAYVIDSSSHYRMNDNVPLIVPYIGDVNIKKYRLFSHSNCIVSPIASVIYPLHSEFGIEKVIASTYQSVSGAGKTAMDECFEHTKYFCNTGKRENSNAFPRSIPFNIIPQIGEFDNNGISSEEMKIMQELNKVVHKDISIFATSVRVPALVGHSVSLSLRLQRDFSLLNVQQVLKNSKRLKVTDEYSTPIEVEGADDVFVSRIRCDERWIHMWLCSDNLRVGAACDAFYITSEIAQRITS